MTDLDQIKADRAAGSTTPYPPHPYRDFDQQYADEQRLSRVPDMEALILAKAERIKALEAALGKARAYLGGGNPLHMSGGVRNVDLRVEIDAALTPENSHD